MTIFDEPSRKPLPADPKFADHRNAVIKGALGSFPVLGGVLSEELGLLLAPPLAQRRDEWFEDLARRLYELEERVVGFRFDDLRQNQQFVSATVQATQSALQTRDQEKLEALRNAVSNIALNRGGNDDRQAIFMSLLDNLTPPHLRMLKLLDEPQEEIKKSSAVQLLSSFSEHPQFQQLDKGAIQLLFEDLKQAALVELTANDPRDFSISAWGRSFLEFVTTPKELRNEK